MKKIIPIVITISLVGFLIYAVTFNKKEIPVEKTGQVIAAPAYEMYFEAAPSLDIQTSFPAYRAALAQ